MFCFKLKKNISTANLYLPCFAPFFLFLLCICDHGVRMYTSVAVWYIFTQAENKFCGLDEKQETEHKLGIHNFPCLLSVRATMIVGDSEVPSSQIEMSRIRLFLFM